MAKLRKLIRRHDDAVGLHASHFSSDLRSLLRLRRNKVDPRLLHPLSIADRVDRRSRCVGQLAWGHAFDARPIPLDGSPDPLLRIPNRSARHQRERVERRGQPVEQSPNRHELRFARGTTARKPNEAVVTALVKHVVRPRVPNEVLALLVEEHLRRIFEVLLAGKHVRIPLQHPKTPQLNRPIGHSLRPKTAVAGEVIRWATIQLNETVHKSKIPQLGQNPATTRHRPKLIMAKTLSDRGMPI